MVLEKTLENPLDFKEIQPVHPKGNQSWIFIERTDAEAETPILWPPDEKSWLIWKDWEKFWERLKIGGEGDDRGWGGWVASLTQWTWVWVNSGSWWWTGRPGMLQSMGSQKSDKTEWLNWNEACPCLSGCFPGDSVVKNLSANSGDTVFIPDPGTSCGEGNGNPLQFLYTTEQLNNNNSIAYLSIIHWEATNAHKGWNGVNINFSIPKSNIVNNFTPLSFFSIYHIYY